MKTYIPIVVGLIALSSLTLTKSNITPVKNDSKFDRLIAAASVRHRVPMPLIKAIIRVESTFNSDAINPSDPSAGLMQTRPSLASAVLGKSVTLDQLKDPSLSIEAGTKFLSILIKKYNLDSAIQAYNLGETQYRKGVRAPNYLAKVKKYMVYYA